MGGGTKEKVARLQAESRFGAELVGIRSLFMLLFVCVVLFALSLAVNLSLSLESPSQQAALFSKMAKERTERAERWKRRNAKHLALNERSADSDGAGQNTLKRDSDGDAPAWATERDANQQKKKKKKLNDADDEADQFGEEQADMEVRAKMGEWMREASLTRSSSAIANVKQESANLISLRKRQQFVEDGLDAVTAHDELDDFDLKALLETDDGAAEDSSSKTALEALKSKQHQADVAAEEKEETITEPILGVSGANPAIKALRSSNFFTAPSAKADKAFGSHLQLLGYTAATVSGSKTFPFWVLQYGLKCPEIADPTERHVLICPYYFPTTPGSRYLAVHAATRSPKQVMQELLVRSKHKRGDGQALSQALAEVYDSSVFAKEVFRLFKDKAKLESHLARDEERRPIFVVTQNDGQTQAQLTDNVPALLAGEKKYASKQLVLKRYSLSPVLWQDRKFVLRTYVVIFNADPLMVLYMQGPALRASEPFVKPPSGSVETAPAAVHFPGAVTTSEKFSWKQFLLGLTLRDPNYVKHRMRQIAAYAVLSLGAAKQALPVEEASRSISIQHLCMDFSLEENEDVFLEAIRTDCPIVGEKEEHVLVDAVNVLGEEMVFRKTRQEPFAFASLPSFATLNTQKLEVLFDEVKEQEKGRSLLDVLESLVAARSASSSSSQSTHGAQQAKVTCESPQPLLVDAHQFNTYQTSMPVCSSLDLDSLFSTAAVVGNGEEVDVETFYNSKIQKSLQASIKHLFAGSFRQALQEARLAGYAPCARVKKRTVSTVFVPTAKGLSPFAIKTFACGGAVPPKDLIIEIPHPFFDHTRQEGLALFDGQMTKVLIMSGTHRCSIAPPSRCTGSLGKQIRTNCAGRTEYQNGDVAHSIENTFWVAHVSLADALADSLVVSLHSTKQESFIISDGTSAKVDPTSPLAKVALGLSRAFTSNEIESCNDFVGSPNKRTLNDHEREVCGATNVQGRHLNGAADPCEAEIAVDGTPLQSSGRFIHIEQPVVLVKEDGMSLSKGVERALKEYFSR